MFNFKKIVLAACLLLCMSAVYGRSISDVERSGSWYYFYDESGKKYKTQSVSSMGELMGFSGSIAVFKHGSWIYVYDAELKKLYTGSVSSCGEVIAVAGDTFTTRRGSWVYTFSKTGKKISTRTAR